MKTIKFFVVFTMAVLLSAGLFAGGAGDSRSSSAQGNNRYDIEIMTISYVGGGWPDDFMIIKRLNEKLNINLKFQWIPSDTFAEKISVVAASNSFPDSYLLNQQQFMQWRDTGIFLDIKPLINNYSNLTTYLEKPGFEIMNPSDKYYGLPYYAIESRDSLYIRKDWLDTLGLKMPDTVEDFLNVCKAFAVNDPDRNGRADTIGFTTDFSILSQLFYLSGAFGVPNGWKIDSGNLVPWQICNNEVKAFLSYMKRMYDENALDKDFVINKGQEPRNKFLAGKVGVFDCNPMDLQTVVLPALRENAPGAVIVPVTPPRGPTGLRATKTYAMNTKVVINSKIDAGKQRRILELYDYMLSDEGYDMIKNGIEGVHYRNNGNGTFTKLPAFDEDRPFILSTWLLRRWDPIIQIRKWDSKEYADEIAGVINSAARYVVRNPAIGLVSETGIRVSENIDEGLRETMARIVVGELDVSAYDRAVDVWRRGGGDAIIREMNNEYSKQK